jgi:hypothetical protein
MLPPKFGLWWVYLFFDYSNGKGETAGVGQALGLLVTGIKE